MDTVVYVVHPGTDTFFAADEAYITVGAWDAKVVDVAPNVPTIAQLLAEQKEMIALIQRVADLVEAVDNTTLADAGYSLALDAHDLLYGEDA